MQGTTLLIGILGTISVLLLPPVYALVAYFSALVWYPDFLRVSIGTIDISVGRIVITVLLLRCLCNSRIRRKFVWSRFDTYVALSMVVYVGMYCVTRPLTGLIIENRGGFVIDTWFSYLVARMMLNDKASFISFVKGISVVLVPLAILGVIEAVTHWQPFYQLSRFRAWRLLEPEVELRVRNRWGFTRAIGPFSHYIMFGASFVMFLPLIWGLRHQRGYWGKLAYPLSAIAIVGALSSMSSGPWGMLIVVIFCLVLGKYERWTKKVLMWLAVLCILVEIGSNRPLYHVLLNYLNFGKGDWYQRAKLIDAAIEHVDEWWLAGYGGKYHGWGPGLIDTNNEFILKGLRYGGLGVVALCAVLVAAFRGLVRASKETTDKELQSFYWSMGSALVGVIVIWQGVSFFGTSIALYHCLLGIIGSSFCFTKCVNSNGSVGNENLVLLCGERS